MWDMGASLRIQTRSVQCEMKWQMIAAAVHSSSEALNPCYRAHVIDFHGVRSEEYPVQPAHGHNCPIDYLPASGGGLHHLKQPRQSCMKEIVQCCITRRGPALDQAEPAFVCRDEVDIPKKHAERMRPRG